MTAFLQCKPPYPQLCKVWNDFEYCYYFAVVVDESHGVFIDQNGGTWLNQEPITEDNLKNPIELLEGNKVYDRFTKVPEEKEVAGYWKEFQ